MVRLTREQVRTPGSSMAPQLLLLVLAVPWRGGAAAPVDCNAVVSAAYKAILGRDADAGGLESYAKACTAKAPWTDANFKDMAGGAALVGQPWSPAGMVLEFRASDEYKANVKSVSQEKGGCRHCAAAQKSTDCLTTEPPPEDDSVIGCVISLTAAECCMPEATAWGAVFLLTVLIAGDSLPPSLLTAERYPARRHSSTLYQRWLAVRTRGGQAPSTWAVVQAGPTRHRARSLRTPTGSSGRRWVGSSSTALVSRWPRPWRSPAAAAEVLYTPPTGPLARPNNNPRI